MSKVVKVGDLQVFLPNVSHVREKTSEGVTTHYDVYMLSGAKITIQESDLSLEDFNTALEEI